MFELLARDLHPFVAIAVAIGCGVGGAWALSRAWRGRTLQPLRNVATGSALLLFVAIAFAIYSGAVADRSEKLSYYGAIDPDPFDAEPGERASEGDDCAWLDGTFETFAGVPVSVMVTKQPQWEIGFGEIRSATIYEAIPSPGGAWSNSHVFVYLEVGGKTKERIDALREPRCGTFVRVEHDGRHLGIERFEGLEPGVFPGGSFGSREEAERFYGSIEDRVSFAALSEEDRAYWQNQNDELVERALWMLKCDPDYLKSLGDGASEHIMSTPSLRQKWGEANCEQKPK